MLFNRFKQQQQHKAERESEARHKFVAQLEGSEKLAQYLEARPAKAQAALSTPAKTPVQVATKTPTHLRKVSRAVDIHPKPVVPVQTTRPVAPQHRLAKLDMAFVNPKLQHALPVIAPKPAPKPQPVMTRPNPIAQTIETLEKEVERAIAELKDAVEEKLPVAQTATRSASLLLPGRDARITVPERASSNVYFRPSLAR